MKISMFFLGFTEVETDEKYTELIFDICMTQGFTYDSIQKRNGTVSLRLLSFTANKLIKALSEYGVEARIKRTGGLPKYCMWFKHRLGLVAGAAIAVFLIVFSSLFVWDVRIEGSPKLGTYEIKNQLEEKGLRIGSFIPSIDISKLENRVLMDSDDISWISVNIRGTVASIQVREKVKYPEDDEKPPYTNVVAARSGRIVTLEPKDGYSLVKHGDTVEKGQLLISGISEGEMSGVRLSHASGKVFAVTDHTFSVKIPYEYEEKVYTGRNSVEKSLIFFGKTIKIYNNKVRFSELCDIIDVTEVNIVRGIGGVPLPLGIYTEKKCEYEMKSFRRDEESAEELAVYRLKILMEKELVGAELLMKKTRIERTADSLILICDVECIENIAKEIPISTDFSDDKKQ